MVIGVLQLTFNFRVVYVNEVFKNLFKFYYESFKQYLYTLWRCMWYIPNSSTIPTTINDNEINLDAFWQINKLSFA